MLWLDERSDGGMWLTLLAALCFAGCLCGAIFVKPKPPEAMGEKAEGK
jgi:hypothetical protein